MWSPHWSTSGHASYLLPDSSKMGGGGTVIDLVREEGEINSVFCLDSIFWLIQVKMKDQKSNSEASPSGEIRQHKKKKKTLSSTMNPLPSVI